MRVQMTPGSGLEFRPETEFEQTLVDHLARVLMGNVSITLEPGGPRQDLENPALTGTKFDASSDPN